jgi:hypothetical protein
VLRGTKRADWVALHKAADLLYAEGGHSESHSNRLQAGYALNASGLQITLRLNRWQADCGLLRLKVVLRPEVARKIAPNKLACLLKTFCFKFA